MVDEDEVTGEKIGSRDGIQEGGARVTEEGLELLDYDGTKGRRGNDALYPYVVTPRGRWSL